MLQPLQQIKRETEQTRAGLTDTVEQLKTSVTETASDLRQRIQPHQGGRNPMRAVPVWMVGTTADAGLDVEVCSDLLKDVFVDITPNRPEWRVAVSDAGHIIYCFHLAAEIIRPAFIGSDLK